MAKRIDKDIEASYYKHCAGTTIDVMDIGKLYKDVREAVNAGTEVDVAVQAAIKKYDKGAH